MSTVRSFPSFVSHARSARVGSRRPFESTPGCAGSKSRPGWSIKEKYVRYQALFPTTIAEGKSTHEIPFGSIERPGAIEFPAQNWVDHSDGRRGLALLNMGLPGNVVTDGTMMVSLFALTPGRLWVWRRL